MPRLADDLDALEELVESQVATHLSERTATDSGDVVRSRALDALELEQDRYLLRVIRQMRAERQATAAKALAAEPTLATIRKHARQHSEVVHAAVAQGSW